MNGLLGAVLIGGKSSRMGRDKSQLPHPSGGRFLDHAIRQLAPLCKKLAVAGSADQQSEYANNGPPGQNDVEFLLDPASHLGPVVGIVGALRIACVHQLSACLVIPVDMPDLEESHLRKLVDAWKANKQLTCAIDDQSRVQPLVAIYPVQLLDQMVVLSESENRSLTRWLAAQDHQTVDLPAAACRNVNHPSDRRD